MVPRTERIKTKNNATMRGRTESPQLIKRIARSGGCQSAEVPAADDGAHEFVVVRAGPMRFKAEPAGVAVPQESGNLPLPVDGSGTERPPDRLVTVHVAVFGVDVGNAVLRQKIVTVGERVLAG